MSKKMTPCEKLGYKVGDKFKVVDGTGVHYAVGSFITLIHDDGSSCPRFNGVHAIYESGDSFFPLDFVEKVAKLKPAKQALADAIHQNGGWVEVATFAVSGYGCVGTTDTEFVISFFNGKSKPSRDGENYWSVGGGDSDYCGDIHSIGIPRLPPNWHQCILSRDEYFTAYPEQVKVEVKNETKHKVEVEMKSESEMTINVSDWHKNGELPPVGEVCIFDPNGRTEFFDEKAIGAIGKEVSIISHVKFKGAVGSVAVFMCDSDGVAIVRTASETCFRPLRTERDKAIDEIISTAKKIGWNSEMANQIIGEVAVELYEAGYRKEVK